MRTPQMIAHTALYPRIEKIAAALKLPEIRMGSISSEVERKTATRVPTVIIPPE